MTSCWTAFRASPDCPAHVFVNASAGGGRARSLLPRLRQLFESLAVPFELVETSNSGELESAARQTASQAGRLLFALGGDGTFQALVNGAFGTDVVLGVIPVGGGNDFASALGLPVNPLKAAASALTGKVRAIDLVRVYTSDGRTRLYAGGGGVGLDAEAARHAGGSFRHLPGRLRYLASALRALAEHQPLNTRIEFPQGDHSSLEASALLAGVLNTPTYGAGLRLAPEASIDDGLLNIVLIENLSKLEVVKLLPRLIGTGELRTSHVRRWTTRSVKICADRLCLFHGDGEILGPAPVEIEVLARAVQVLVPAFK